MLTLKERRERRLASYKTYRDKKAHQRAMEVNALIPQRQNLTVSMTEVIRSWNSLCRWQDERPNIIKPLRYWTGLYEQQRDAVPESTDGYQHFYDDEGNITQAALWIRAMGPTAP
jgi:hypothetical protein